MAPETSRLMAKWAARILSGLLLGLVMFAVAVLIVIPRATHGTALTVLTGSMTPGIPVGSLVIDRPVDPGTLHVGDIATYQVAPGHAEYITHRIVKIDASRTPVAFIFKGDANRGPDMRPVPATAIRGKVWFHVPYLGAIRDAMHTKGGLAAVGMLVLAGYALFQAAGALRGRGNTGATTAQPTATDLELLAPAVAYGPRATLVATFPVDALQRVSPQLATALLRARLLGADDTTFVIALTDSVERVDDTAALLRRSGATAVEMQLPDEASVAIDETTDRALVSFDA